MSKQFKVGDKVVWRSQAASVYSNKTGEVIDVIPAGQRPKLPGCGMQRKHESYLIRATSDSTGRVRKYWPIVSLLKTVEDKLEFDGKPIMSTYTITAKEGEDLRDLSNDELVNRAVPAKDEDDDVPYTF